VALGQATPDLVLRGGRVFSVFTGELLEADVALCGELIAGLGDYPDGPGLDARGLVVLPGLLDAHVHVESSLLSPARFAEAIVVHGTTTCLVEPHELTNILGAAAIEFFLSARRGLPVDLRVMLPSSVPASPFEQGAVRMGSAELAPLLREAGVQGLGEVMDYPAVLRGAAVWDTLAAARGAAVDGHAPGLSSRELDAYLLGGMITDHETADPALVLERRRLGMWTLLREGSTARDLDALLPFLREHGLVRTALCTDDRHAGTLSEDHHIDGSVSRLVRAGVPAREALAAATIAPAELYRLFDRGAVAPGRRADLLLVEDPAEPHPRHVLSGGKMVVEEGHFIAPLPPTPMLPPALVRVHVPDPDLLAPAAPAGSGPRRARALRVSPGSLTTGQVEVTVPSAGGRLRASAAEDVVLLALLERHRGTGQIGTGLVTGLGLRRGALAGSVAHDAHHLIVAGADVGSMAMAVEAVRRAGGGLAVAEGADADVLPLPLAGLMTDRPAVSVAADLRRLEAWLRARGVLLEAPFMTLSFLALTVIPSLRITITGLLDVDQGKLVPVLLG